MPKKEIKKDQQKDLSKAHQDPDYVRFAKTVSPTSDPVTMILKCHLLSEYYLDRVIALEIERGDIILDSKFQFYDKLIIVEALNVIPKYVIDALRKLNSIRNNCSHVLDYEITEIDIDKIGMPFRDVYLSDKKEAGSDTKQLLHMVLLTAIARLSGCVEIRTEERLKGIKNKSLAK